MNGHVKRDPMGWYGHTPYYGVVMNRHVARNTTWRCGHTPCCGIIINAHLAHYLCAVAW